VLDSIKGQIAIQTSDSLILQNYFHLAREFQNNAMHDSAIKYSLQAFSIASQSGNKRWLADALLFLGKAELISFGPRDRAVRHLLKSLEIYTVLEDKTGMGACNMQLGVLSYDMENYPNAVDYFLAALKHSQGKPVVSTIQYLLALSYSEVGNYEEAQKMFDAASKGFGDDRPVYSLQIKTFTGKMYVNMGNYKKAIEVLSAIIETRDTTLQIGLYTPAYAFISTAYLALKEYENAIKNGTIAYQNTKNKPAYTIYHREATDNLHRAYKAVGNIDSAFYFLSELRVLNDSITSNNVLQRVAELKGNFDFEQEMTKQKAEQAFNDALKNKELERQKLLRNLFVGGFILVMLFAGIFLKQRNNVSKEKKRSDELLLNILPAITAEELKANGKTEAKLFNEVTVMFTDFKGFTELSDQLSPTQLVSEIHSYFSAFDAIIDKYNIEKIKTIGDSYMAASGMPLSTLKSTKNAVLAALEMLEYLHKNPAENGLPILEMRCGLHTGPIVAGIVGIKKFQYDIWGDTVNTASRMESNGVAGRVNISRKTYEILKDDPDFTFEKRGEIDVKGKGKMEMYFVQRA